MVDLEVEVEVEKDLQRDNAVACKDPENSVSGVLATIFIVINIGLDKQSLSSFGRHLSVLFMSGKNLPSNL